MSKNSKLSINKVSFFCIGAVAILYLVSLVLGFFNISSLALVCNVLTNIANAIMVIIIAILAWNYVKGKSSTYKVLFFVFLLVVLVGIVLPLIF